MAELNRRRLLLGSAGILALGLHPLVQAATKFLSGRITPERNRTRIVLETDNRIRYTYFMLDAPPRLVVDIENLAYTPGMGSEIARKIQSRDIMIRNIRSGQKDKNTVRLVADLKTKAQVSINALNPSGGSRYRLQIDLQPAAGAAANTGKTPAAQNRPDTARQSPPAPNTQSDDPLLDFMNEKQIMQPEPPLADNGARQPEKQRGRRKPVVVLDPGHGGKDPGATGPTGLREKDVVLAVALEAKKQLEAQGCQVYLTRSTDIFVQLKDRRRTARQVNADIFVSIHANASESPAAAGTEVFIWGQANSDLARKLADKENKADLVDGIPSVGNKEVDNILTDMMQAQTTTDSTRLGNLMLQRIARYHRLRHKTSETANFVVLRSLDIPSVLIELAFITNPAEEQQLKGRALRAKLADGIAEGIGAYLKNAVLR